MNPPTPEFNKFELPRPVEQDASPAKQEAPVDNPETVLATQPTVTGAASAASSLATPASAIADMSGISSVATAATIDPDDLPDAEEDVRVIEKEWVVRAKKIIKETHDDPRAQNDKLSQFKAGYIKKRYNKDIKI